MTEETVYNADPGPKSCNMFCNWCTADFTYHENADEYHDHTTCPWCAKRLKIPRERLRRINGVNPRAVRDPETGEVM